MNGVISASVSPGSSQRETSVTWTPHVMVPSCAASAGEMHETITRTMATITNRGRISIPPRGGLPRSYHVLYAASPMSHVYAVRCNFSRPDLEQAWHAWYSGPKLAEMMTHPLFLSGERYRASGLDQRVIYLDAWVVESPAAFETRQHRASCGFAARGPCHRPAPARRGRRGRAVTRHARGRDPPDRVHADHAAAARRMIGRGAIVLAWILLVAVWPAVAPAQERPRSGGTLLYAVGAE